MGYDKFLELMSAHDTELSKARKFNTLDECIGHQFPVISQLAKITQDYESAVWLWACVCAIHRRGGGGPDKYLNKSQELAAAWGKIANTAGANAFNGHKQRFENWLKAESWEVFYQNTLRFLELVRVKEQRFTLESLYLIAIDRAAYVNGADNKKPVIQTFRGKQGMLFVTANGS
ncbi:hypothetical protein FNX24_21695 [Salmonella enterica]|nr:hypothetical protein [Salmonella enterica]